jgi:zinc transport system ATP-binding protein
VRYDGLKKKEIGYLAQQTTVQKDFPVRVMEAVLSGCMGRHGIMPFYSRGDRATAQEKLRLLGAENLAGKSYRDLSGGQQQRVLLARALCAAEKMLFLDEPVAGLDPLMTAELYGILETLNDEGMTIIMVSHDVESAMRYGNKILHMRTRPVFFGATEDYRGSAAAAEILERKRFVAEDERCDDFARTEDAGARAEAGAPARTEVRRV